MKITILGRGAWGRAISTLVERLNHEVTFASHHDSGWPAGHAPDFVLLALPVQHVRETLQRFGALQESRDAHVAGRRCGQNQPGGQSRRNQSHAPHPAVDHVAEIPSAP